MQRGVTVFVMRVKETGEIVAEGIRFSDGCVAVRRVGAQARGPLGGTWWESVSDVRHVYEATGDLELAYLVRA